MECKEYLERYRKKLSAEIERLQDRELPAFTKEAYQEYFQNGNRVSFEKIYFGRREFLTDYGVWVIINQKPGMETMVKRLLDIVSEILSEPTWVLPAHGSMKHFEGEAVCIDLFAAETAGSIAEILALLDKHPAVKEDQECKESYVCVKHAFWEAFQVRILSVFQKANPCDWWEYGNMNWSSVCAGNVGIAVYYLYKMGFMTEEELIQTTIRVSKSMKSYLLSMGEDGACAEGVGYYQYGMQYYLAWDELLHDFMQEKCPEIESVDIHKLAMFLPKVALGGGNYVNFSDCLLQNPIKMGILAYLASRYPDVSVPKDYCDGERLQFSDWTEFMGGSECHRFAGALRDYLWIERYGEDLQKEEGSLEVAVFPEHMWYIRKFENGISFFAKGGNNDEPHNHNDVGSIAYMVNGEEVLCDLGSGEYVKDYFNENRYRFLCNCSLGHNVPMLGTEGNGQQLAGAECCADFFYADRNGMEVHFGKAYGKASGEAVCRTVTCNDQGDFEIRDHVDVALCGQKKGSYTESFVSKLEPVIEGHQVRFYLQQEQNKGRYVVLSFVEEQVEKPEIEKLDFTDHTGKRIEVYRVFAVAKGTVARMYLACSR